MSNPAMNPSNPPAKPVSWFSVAVVFVGLGLFLLVVKYTYLSHRAPAPHTIAPEQLPADQAWKATPDTRKAALAELRAAEQKQVSNYAWIDQAKGVVQLPIERAMELTVQELKAKQPAQPTSNRSSR
jgi:hypothetical protein